MLRYWDGHVWTEHVHPAVPTAVSVRPVGGPPPRPATPDGQPLAEWWQRLCAYLTLGMVALGICVRLRERPGKLPWSTILLRVLVQQGVLLTAVVPLLYLALSWFPYLDALWMFWDDQRRTLHDKAAKTNVVLR